MSAAQAAVAPSWQLPQLLDGVVAGAPSLTVNSLSMDSRNLQPGALFVALRGAQHDGRAYLGQAAAGGAVAALVEDAALEASAPLPQIVVPGLRQRVGAIASRFFGHPSRDLHLVAVTGTNGKTTVSQVLAQLVRAAGYDCGVIGTLGVSLDPRPAETLHTTPDAIALQQTLAQWVAGAVPFVSMEASSHALDQGRMVGVDVDTAVFTNLTRDHLDYHGDMAAYGRAKALLFRMPGLRTAVLNAEDPFSAELAALLAPEVTVIRYGIETEGTEFTLRDLVLNSDGFRARFDSPWGRGTLRSALLGRFNVSNVAAALAAALSAGLPLDGCLAAIAALRPVPGRMEPLRVAGRPLVVIDYAHTPDALAQVLQALRPQVKGQLHLVFGCGGDRDRGKRAEMARAASRGADRSLVTSDNPRTEDPLSIIADIEAAMEGEYRVQPDRAAAIAEAVAGAAADDCVLIAGKGHEDYQIVGRERLPFSDSEQARRALGGMPA